METLQIKSGSALRNKGTVTLKFESKDSKKAFVKANLKQQVKQPVLDGTEVLKAVVAEQQFESELEAWADEQGYVLAEDKPVHNEPLRFLSFSATKPTKVRRLAEFMTKEEWNCKILSSLTMKRLGLKGSPKLSKVLVSLGVPSRKVELMLGGSVKSVVASNVSYVTNDAAYIEAQGNSVYYSSCQATDSRARWSGDDSYCRVEEDLQAIESGLFLWCIGDPMHKDSKGFIARAKLRLLTDSDNEVCGLYIDRPYGAHQLLMDNVDDLVSWWSNHCAEQGYGNQPIYLAPTWQREDGEGANFEYRFGGRSKPMYCHSAELGYQDTMSNGYGPYTFFKRLGVESGTWTKKAYLARPKQDNVYLCSLKDVDYNAQKAAFVTPNVVDKPWRGFISEEQKELAYNAIQYIRMPDSKFDFSNSKYEVRFVINNKSIIIDSYGSSVFKVTYDHRTAFSLSHNNWLEVESNGLKDLGFMVADQIPYSYNNKTLTVERTAYGFTRAVSADVPINMQGHVVVNRDGFNYPVSLPYVDKRGHVVVSWQEYNSEYGALSNKANTNLSILPWAEAVEIPYTIKGDTLTVTQDVKGYYATAVSLKEQPFTIGVTDNFDNLGFTPKLQVTKDLSEYGYFRAELLSTWKISTFREECWRKAEDMPGRSRYSVKIVNVTWPEEGYMPPCNLDDAPTRGTSYAPPTTSYWQDVFDIEDDVYGDRVLNRLPDPYFSEEEEDYDEFLFD